MKKLWMLLVLFLLMITSAAAEDSAARIYTIPMTRGDVTFSAPEDMVCLTRESSASEFNAWDMSQRESFAYMEEWDVYALLYDLETGDSYQIAVYPYAAEDYDSLTDAQALDVSEWLKAEMQAGGLEVLATGWHQGSSCDFAVLELRSVYDDGYVENSSRYVTNQANYCMQIIGFPYEGELTDTVRTGIRQMADSLTITQTQTYVTGGDFHVDTEKQADGRVVLTTPGVRVTVVPLNNRCVATRESDRVVFGRMGFGHLKALTDMKERDIYVLLTDEEGVLEIQVGVYGAPGAKDYDQLDDAELYEMERRTYLEYDIPIGELDVFVSDTAKFTRASESYQDDDGVLTRNINYYTRINGCEISVQAYLPEEQALDTYTEMLDAFVRNMVFEKTAE